MAKAKPVQASYIRNEQGLWKLDPLTGQYSHVDEGGSFIRGVVPVPRKLPIYRGWMRAYKAYQANPVERGFVTRMSIKFMPLATALLPFNAADDMIPVLGELDDAAYLIMAIIAINKLRQYRR